MDTSLHAHRAFAEINHRIVKSYLISRAAERGLIVARQQPPQRTPTSHTSHVRRTCTRLYLSAICALFVSILFAIALHTSTPVSHTGSPHDRAKRMHARRRTRNKPIKFLNRPRRRRRRRRRRRQTVRTMCWTQRRANHLGPRDHSSWGPVFSLEIFSVCARGLQINRACN